MDYLFIWLGLVPIFFVLISLFFLVPLFIVWELEFRINPHFRSYLYQNLKIDTILKFWLPILSIFVILMIIGTLLNIYYYFRNIYYWSDVSFIERFKYPAYYLLIILGVITYSELIYRLFHKVYKPTLQTRRLIYLQSFAILVSFNFINFLIR